jgi:hypothetical protein
VHLRPAGSTTVDASTVSAPAVRAPLVAFRAQQPDRLRRIGVLYGVAETDLEGQAWNAAFRKRLSELGWIDDRNVHVEYRWSGGWSARYGPWRSPWHGRPIKKPVRDDHAPNRWETSRADSEGHLLRRGIQALDFTAARRLHIITHWHSSRPLPDLGGETRLLALLIKFIQNDQPKFLTKAELCRAAAPNELKRRRRLLSRKTRERWGRRVCGLAYATMPRAAPRFVYKRVTAANLFLRYPERKG